MTPERKSAPIHSERVRRGLLLVVAACLAIALSGCGAFGQALDDFNAAISGRSGTMSTYNEDAQLVDSIHGKSFHFERDTTFDTKNSDGSSNGDSSVVKVSLGNNTMYTVGSTMIFAQDGLVDVMKNLPETARFANHDPGTPWLNSMRESFQNLWKGKAKTIMIRSQNGTPLAVYAGNSVSVFATDIPKSTVFRIDDHYLLVYRADYLVVDNELLSK